MKTQLGCSFAIRLALFSLMMLTASSAAVGQNMYSDVYFDDSDAENGHGYVVGVGVTEDSYNSYSHEYQITSTLTAADNTSDTAQGLGVGTYAYGSAEAVIEWTELTAGNFILATEHKIVCPYWNMEYWESSTYAEKTLNHFGTETFHYIVDYPKLAPNKCAYDLCADQEQKDCFWWAYGSEDYSASNPANGSDGCFKYLSRNYVRVTDPWAGSNWCIKGSKRGSDEKPPGYCGY